jgi:NADH-quinone oxidoreductase subunit N
VFVKVLVLLGAMAPIVLALDYIEREGMARVEYPILIVLSTLGMLVMVSANDLIALYLGSSCSRWRSTSSPPSSATRSRSTEAGLKYFVLGALSRACCSTAAR